MGAVMATEPRGANNVLNIEKGQKWQGLADEQRDPRFASFKSVQFCLRAGARILLAYKARDITTVAGMIATWAPPSDNNPTAIYAANVAQAMGVGVNDEIDIDQCGLMLPALKAMARQESGYTADDSVFLEAMRMAGVHDVKPKPLARSNQVLAAAGSAVLSGGAAIASMNDTVVAPVTKALAPYAQQNHHVGQVIGILAGIGAALAALAVVLRYFQQKRTGQ